MKDRAIIYSVCIGMGAALGGAGAAIFDGIRYHNHHRKTLNTYRTFIENHPPVQGYLQLAEKISQGQESDGDVNEFIRLRTHPEVVQARALRNDAGAIPGVPSWTIYYLAGVGAWLGLGVAAFAEVYERKRARAALAAD